MKILTMDRKRPTVSKTHLLNRVWNIDDHFRKTFITQNQKQKEPENLWTLHDIIIPAGRTAKLVRIPDPSSKDFRISEPCDKLKFVDQAPVIILSGTFSDRGGKFLAGATRAAYRSGAYIIDSGIKSGIEKFCMRKQVPLIGVSPECEISYPKINPTKRKDNELSNGHTDFFLLGDDNHVVTWGDKIESEMKFNLAQRIASGRSSYGKSKYQCKIVVILVGDNPSCVGDLEMANELNIPVIVLEGSDMCNSIIGHKGGFPGEEAGDGQSSEQTEKKDDDDAKSEAPKKET